MFRKWRAAPRTVVAVFPEIDAGVSLGKSPLCLSYEHVGQHSGAQYSNVISLTTPATPEEYAELKEELESLGYVLDVRKYKPMWNRNYKNKRAI